MQADKAQKIIKDLIVTIEKDGLDNESIVSQLKELREIAKTEEDPLLVKTLRLIYEYLGENEAFDIEPTMPKVEATDDEEEEEMDDMTDQENLVYLLQLISKSQNQYNRDEIKGYRTALWEDIY